MCGCRFVDSAAAWVPPRSFPPALEMHISQPIRNGTHFPTYQMARGGTLTQFSPPESFWGLANPPGGGGSTYIVPSGLSFSPSNFSVNYPNWSNPTTGIVHAFHSGYVH